MADVGPPVAEMLLREPLPADRAKLEWLIGKAEDHVADCNLFFFRVRLLQQLQIEIVEPIARADSPYKAFIDAQRTGELERLSGHDEAYRQYVQGDIAKRVHCPNMRLLRYLNLAAFRNDDGYVETLQALQAALVRTDFRCRFEHREVSRMAGDPAIPDEAFNEPTRRKYAEWGANCQALIDYYRAWRDAEVPFVEAFITEAKRHLAEIDAAPITPDEVEAEMDMLVVWSNDLEHAGECRPRIPIVDEHGNIAGVFDAGSAGVELIMEQCNGAHLGTRAGDDNDPPLSDPFYRDWQVFRHGPGDYVFASWHDGEVGSVYTGRAVSIEHVATLSYQVGQRPHDMVLDDLAAKGKHAAEPPTDALPDDAAAVEPAPSSVELLSPRTFILGDKHVDLTKLQFRLVECLLRHDRHTATARKVCIELWDDEEAESSKLRPHIHRTNNRFVEAEMPVTISVEAGYVKLAIGDGGCKFVAIGATEMQPDCNRA